jgi:hypothetical protein
LIGRSSVAAITRPSGRQSANARTFIAARQPIEGQSSWPFIRNICVVCIVNIAAQKSALNTWICVIVRRAAESMPGGAVRFDASGAETVAPIADWCAAMGAARKVESQDYALSVREALECALRWRRINTKTRWMTKTGMGRFSRQDRQARQEEPEIQI